MALHLLLLLIESTSHQLDFVQPVLNTFLCIIIVCCQVSRCTRSCTKGHLNKCSKVCGSVSQSHMVSLEGLYPHLLSVTLALPTQVLSRLRHFHFAQLSSAPGGSCSLATLPIVVEGGRLLFISSHIVNLASLVVVSASRGLTHLRKLFLDFRRF